mmetsp:Transcript_14404/g.39668  ORF Transcript_14404/g.39668 Transcript_14404/m.39668 type:complete len:133 (-) Transcript_14404:319-717(-)
MPRRKQTTPANENKENDPVLQHIVKAMQALKEPSVNEIEEWIATHLRNCVIPKGSVKDTLKKGTEQGVLVKIKNGFKHGYPCYRLARPGSTAQPLAALRQDGNKKRNAGGKGFNRIRQYQKQESIHVAAGRR